MLVALFMKTISIYFILLLLAVSNLLAQNYDPVRLDSLYQCCLPLVEQEEIYSYGPPNTPNINLDVETLNKYEQKLDEESINTDEIYELAYLYYHFNRFDEAIRYFKKSRELNNFSIQFYPTYLNLHLARIYEKIGELDNAEKYYKAYDDPYFLKLFQARKAKRNENFKLAENLYLEAQAIKLFEVMNTKPFKELALMFKEQGEYEKALYYAIRYRNCLKFENESPESMWGLAPHVLEEANNLVNQISILNNNQ